LKVLNQGGIKEIHLTVGTIDRLKTPRVYVIFDYVNQCWEGGIRLFFADQSLTFSVFMDPDANSDPDPTLLVHMINFIFSLRHWFCFCDV
jgi:hypothetical protein